jgi:hypothetical protein
MFFTQKMFHFSTLSLSAVGCTLCNHKEGVFGSTRGGAVAVAFYCADTYVFGPVNSRFFFSFPEVDVAHSLLVVKM